MDGVVYVFPVDIEEPPDDAVYQFTVPADAVAPSATVPVPQRSFGVVPVIVGNGFTFITITFEFAGFTAH